MTDASRKLSIREGREFARKCTFMNPKYRFRVFMAAQDGTLHPLLERGLWEMGGYLPKGGKTETLSDVVRGLTMLLRKPLHVDPLAEPKPVEGTVIIDQPPQAALPPRQSIVPPARPRKTPTQGQATLKPGEEELR